MNKKSILLLTTFFLFLSAVFVFSAYNNGNKLSNSGYLKDGVAMFMVSHTEYRSGETFGQIIGKLVDYQLEPIAVNYCLVTIYNPDKTTYIFTQATDNTLESVAGTHYINFTTPANAGIRSE